MRVVGSAQVRAEKVMFGSHVVDRFRERVRPDLSFPAARELLRRILPDANLCHDIPNGIHCNSLRDQILTVGWLTFQHHDTSIVLPLVPWPEGLVATTCITRRAEA